MSPRTTEKPDMGQTGMNIEPYIRTGSFMFRKEVRRTLFTSERKRWVMTSKYRALVITL